MFEAFKNKKEEAKKESISLRDKALKVLRDTTKIVTLLSVFSLPLNQELSASNTNEKDPVDLKHKIELAKQAISAINVALEKVCEGSTHTLGYQEIRSFEPIAGTEVVSANNGDWFMLMDKDGSNAFLDLNQDGSVDRFIINNQDEEHEKGLLSNSVYAFGDMEFHAKCGQITSGTEMESDVKIISFDIENNKMACVDMKSGESGIIEGEEVKSFFEKIQTVYTEKLGNLYNEGDQNSSESLDWKETNVEKPIEPPIRNKPEKQPEYNPSDKKPDYHSTFEDYKKAQQTEFDNMKKSQEEEFNKLKERK